MSDSNDVIIAVMGATGSGKTTFINLASNSNLRVGNGLMSCTDHVEAAEPFELNGRNVTLIDTPGFDDTTKSDVDILNMIAEFLATSYINGKRLAGLIYMHRISDFRVSGISTRNFKMFRKLCGESALQNVIIVTNMWSEVFESVGIARETELASEEIFFKPVLAKGAQMLRHANTPASARAIITRIIDNHPLLLQIQKELIDEKMHLEKTAAGQELSNELDTLMRKHKEEIDALQLEMKEAIRAKNAETRQKIETVTNKLQAEIERLEIDRQKLIVKFAVEDLMQKLGIDTTKEGHATTVQIEDGKGIVHCACCHRELGQIDLAPEFVMDTMQEGSETEDGEDITQQGSETEDGEDITQQGSETEDGEDITQQGSETEDGKGHVSMRSGFALALQYRTGKL